MVETISSAWQATAHYFLIGVSLALLLLFVCSCLCIAAWIVNWPIFIFSGVAWGGFAISLAFAWTCLAYYQAFFTWAYPEKTVPPNDAVNYSTPMSVKQSVHLEDSLSKEDQLDALIGKFSKSEFTTP